MYLSANIFCSVSGSEVEAATSDLIWEPPEAADLKEVVLALRDELGVVFKTDAELGLLGTLGGNGGGLSREAGI